VVLSDVPSTGVISAVMIFLTDAEYQKFEAMRVSQRTLLLQGPNPLGQWYIRFGGDTQAETDLRTARTSYASGRDQVIHNVTVTMITVAKPA